MQKIITFLIYLISTTSCTAISYVKVNNLKNKTAVQYPISTRSIRFVNVEQRIIIPVEIEGIVYSFLLDTGAITVIDDDLADELDLFKVARLKLSDYYEYEQKRWYLKLKSISVLGAKFKDIVAVETDLSVLEEKARIKVDGIVGANLLRFACWQINFRDSTLAIAPDLKSFGGVTGDTLHFTPNAQGSPLLRITSETGISQVLMLDTGSGHALSLPDEQRQFVPKNQEFAKSYAKSWAAFGSNADTILHTTLTGLTLGQKMLLPSMTTRFGKSIKTGKLGNSFLSQYLTTIDWTSQRLIFSPLK